MGIKRCRLKDRDHYGLLEYFVLEVTARAAADLMGIQAKRVLRKYNGIPAKQFYWFLKECEFHFNYGSYKEQFATLKKWFDL